MVEYPSDCQRIVDVVLMDRGQAISLVEAERLWHAYSESMAAGWLIISEHDKGDEEILSAFDAYGPTKSSFEEWLLEFKHQYDIEALPREDIARLAYDAGAQSL